MIKKNYICLLFEYDRRKYLTYRRNTQKLVKFARTFGGQLSLVKVKEGELLDLKTLSKTICNPEYKKNPELTVLKRLTRKRK